MWSMPGCLFGVDGAVKETPPGFLLGGVGDRRAEGFPDRLPRKRWSREARLPSVFAVGACFGEFDVTFELGVVCKSEGSSQVKFC